MDTSAAPPAAPPTDDERRFGRWRLQPAQRRLLEGRQPLAVGPRAFDLLLALTARPGELLSKDALLDGVWPGVVVEENNLQVQVSTLRKLLGADAIATVPGRGYRFVLPVAAAPAAPPPRATPTALPGHLPPLLGREAELAELLAAIDSEPLLTLVGPGGIGKTRLAQALAAARAPHEPVAWVELAPLADAALLPGAVAAALGLPLPPGGDPQAALLAGLRPLALRLVLDNAEHLLDAVAGLAQALLQAAPGLRLLVTSQAPLRLAGERVYRLDPLALPPPEATPEQALQHGAVALLVERARAADRRFTLAADNLAAVTAICRRLDGLPLALQLAAARLPLLGGQALADALDQRFALLTAGARGAPERHATLQAALDWSHGLLSADEQAVWRRLAVCVGGFTLELARELAADERQGGWAVIERLAGLVDRSLVTVDGADPPRYALSESGRAYAAQRLAEAGELAAVRARHALALRRRFATAPADWLALPDAAWLARYEPEVDNLRAALAWAAEHDAETLVALVGTAAPLWHHLSLHAEARAWHAASEPLLADAALPPALTAAWWRGAQWAWAEVAPERSRAAAERAHALYLALGDAHGLYAQLTGAAGLWPAGDPRAQAALEQALALERPDWPARERAWGRRALADVARAEGRLSESRAAREAELALRSAAGDERGRLRAQVHLAELALAMGETAEAVQRGRALVAELRTCRAPSTLALALTQLLGALLLHGDSDEAAALAPETRSLAQDHGLLWQAADELALAEVLQGRAERAALLLGWADAAWRARGEPRTAIKATLSERAASEAGKALAATQLAALRADGSELGEEALLRRLDAVC